MEKVVHELLFDGAGNWLFTKTEMSHAAFAFVVKQALDASEYAGYRVDDVDHYVTSAEEYYRSGLESVAGDVKVKLPPPANCRRWSRTYRTRK